MATSTLDVGGGHRLHVERFGRRGGLPVVYLHGGPGSGVTPGHRRFFDPARHHAVLFDQRAAGRSTPHASEPAVDWTSIDLDHHIADIEAVRRHVGIDAWVVSGHSWGAVLAVAYAERHPESVRAVVVGACSTSTRADIEWLTVDAGRFFPEQWDAFRRHVPERLAHLRLVDAYRTLVFDADPAVHDPAAAAWCRWEDAHVAVTPAATPNPRFADPAFRLGFARQVTHCWSQDAWLGPDELVAHAGRLAGIPGWLIHGRLDLSSPLRGPWRLHQAWPGSELIVVDEGHGGPAMSDHVRRLLSALAA